MVELDDMLKLVIVSYNPVTQPPPGPDDQARYTDKGVEETFKLHAYDRKANGTIGQQEAEPGFQIPGQGGDSHQRPVGKQGV